MIAADKLAAFCADILRAVSVPGESARLVADTLVAADLRDTASHGVMLLPLYVDRIVAGSIAPDGVGKIVSDRAGAIVLDAENALGQVTSTRAVQLAVERARAHGMAAVAVRNGFHFGTAGHWAEAMTREDCVGIVMSNTRPLMPAPGGAERVVGNNPLAIAVPAAEGAPIVLDLALSAVAMGKIRLADASGAPIPEGWATDADGNPTTDPAAAIKGMLLPAGGAKGFGLALLIDLLCGGLSSGAIGDMVRPLYGDPAIPYRCAHLFVAIDISAFLPVAVFAKTAESLAQKIRGGRRVAPDGPAPRVPGDRPRLAYETNAGLCHLSAATARALRALGEAHGVPVPAEFFP